MKIKLEFEIGSQNMREHKIISWIVTLLFCVAIHLLNSAYSLAEEQIEKPTFSVARGFYTKPFDLTISSHDEDAVLKYTLDGSDPRFSASASNAASPVVLTVNPDDTTKRYMAPGVVVRAVACVEDTSFSEVETHTYLFINRAADLSPDGVRPGRGWPEPNDRGSAHYYDYGFDLDVLDDPRYKGRIEEALLSIPSLSFVTDLPNLFDRRTGIYEFPNNRGIEWERPTSVELLNPDGTPGFQINAGLRIRGGYSRRNVNPKHAFRLFFRAEYGAANLNYPLFGDEGVDQFDKIDIRTSQNYSWSYDASDNAYNTLTRDVFSRDLQRDIGQPYTRSRYYHLYINGVYWGLFQSQERPEARFAASYFGGNQEDYDVVKVDAGYARPYTIEATDGNLDAWQQVWQMCQNGFASNEDYFRLAGFGADGLPDPDLHPLVDIDNLIDYMVIIFYTGDFDAPVSKFMQNKSPNNFYAIYDRNSPKGFIFFAHDCEHSLFTAAVGPSIGLYENRVNIGNITDPTYRMIVNESSRFHPQWLHYRLADNSEYRIRFADHVYKHFFNHGAMTPESSIQRFMQRADEIDMAIIAESARWGDAQVARPRTKDDDWLPVIDNIIDYFFPVRTDIVLSQLKEEDLYPNIDPPIFRANNVDLLDSKLVVAPGFELDIVNPYDSGSIVYALDGQDPRSIGGTIAEGATVSESQAEVVTQTTTLIKARILNDGTWSAVHELALSVAEDLQSLKITEIHYHPFAEGDVGGREFEFVELKNVGSTTLNISMATFSNGIVYTFPVPTLVNPGEFIVLASNTEQFRNRYNMDPSGEYSGQLENAGERITLLNATGDTIFTVRYNDKSPWPVEADTLGHSIVSKEVNPTGNPDDPAYWRASFAVHGSPGSDDMDTAVEQEKTQRPLNYSLFQNYPNPFNPQTVIDYQLPQVSEVEINIFNAQGQKITTLISAKQSSGFHRVMWDGRDTSGRPVASGIYLCQLKAGDFTAVRKMMLLH
jgi:hypothetical protein